MGDQIVAWIQQSEEKLIIECSLMVLDTFVWLWISDYVRRIEIRDVENCCKTDSFISVYLSTPMLSMVYCLNYVVVLIACRCDGINSGSNDHLITDNCQKI